MPDIRDVLKALDRESAVLYSQIRTDMRRAYMAAHAANLNVAQWTAEDDAVLDLIDIQVAMLFVRSGRFDVTQGHLDIDRKQEIEKEIREREAELSALGGKTPSQKVLDEFAPKQNGRHANQWPNGQADKAMG